MTDTDSYTEAHLPMARDLLERLAPSILAGGFEALDAAVSAMEDDEIDDSLIAMAQRSKVDSLVAGRLAHERRLRTADGEWGREVRRLAMLCEVSDRTIHRWMSSYQEKAGLELTPAQANARVAADRASAAAGPPGGGTEWEIDDDDEDEAGAAGFWDSDPVDNGNYMRGLVGEPDNPAPAEPTTRYENPPEAPRPSGGRPVVPPDETWIAFTSAQISSEHEGYGDQALERMSKARWDRTVREDPLSLLEDLETIHVAGVPDELVEALHAAEEAKALKPEVVAAADKPKKARKASAGSSSGRVAKLADPQAGFANVENGMAYTREVHEHIAQILEEGGPEMLMRVYGKAIDNLASWAFTLDGCLKKLRKAREDVKRIESRQPAATAEDPGF